MENILRKLKVEVNENLFVKDPYSSELGNAILQVGSKLMLELGMEDFTFKKLATEIGVSEPAIYRYFENKHNFLLYLTAWHWAWTEHNLVYVTANLKNPEERLEIAIKLLVEGPMFVENEFLNPIEIRKIVTNESLKGYLTKSVDSEHENGIYAQLYTLGERIAQIIREINPAYKFPITLVNIVMEASLLQSFHAKHLPGMTESNLDKEGRFQFFHHLVAKTIIHE
ncbi:TetR/AcrR family transcriptional regulator [Algoriphagus lutimaris]|uniref:TetR/AcrR family transcriptional regulator n=1 Tax=Algoriphagus lutimaris TaxID=613197 RepID=UPI00196AE283|nr:TetR/AcrR family transcriptional regulator [Algoriphagus lutimaris]MBN3519149.1 TetR/AcrR family transcriptional regulator [Algoriphagus lutimaris]